MKQYFNCNFVNNTIVGSKTSIKKANALESPYYEQLTDLMKQHPSFKVVEKQIKHNPSKKNYANLTFSAMEAYIALKPDAENAKAEYETVKKIGAIRNSAYPTTKKWFLAKYPEFKTNDLPMATADQDSNTVEFPEAAA